jgi:hypothetical protein
MNRTDTGDLPARRESALLRGSQLAADFFSAR